MLREGGIPCYGTRGPGEAPAYVDVLEPGPWIVATTETVPVWAGRITCPDCGATVLQRPAAPKE